MKLNNIFIGLAALSLAACSDWTDIERETYPEQDNINLYIPLIEAQSEEDLTPAMREHYRQIREYRKTPHVKGFGWYGNWTGKGTNAQNYLKMLPDSVDFVSLWGARGNLSAEQKADLKFFQDVKGGKALLCWIIQDIGSAITPEGEDMHSYWLNKANSDAVEASKLYAHAIADTIVKYNLDGFDIDYEPNYGNKGNIVDDDDRMFIFVDELGKHFGPKSGTGKLLIIDGEPQSIKNRPDVGPYFDYFIIQAYKPGNDNNLDKRLIDGGVAGPGLVQTYGSVMSEEQITKMTIMTENFEAVDAAMDGGYPYTDRYGNSMKSLEGMARWQPKNGFRKGGVGSYHMEAEYPTNPEYKNLRKAIQIMNPSTKPLIKY